MKRTMLVALTVLALASHAAGDEEVYRAKSGDTLWDVSGRFWADTFAWPELWALNPHFRNPHWISPGEPIYLGPRGAVLSVRLPLTRLEAEDEQAAGAATPSSTTSQPGDESAENRSDDPAPKEVTFAKGQAQDFISSHRIPPAAVMHNRKLEKQMYGTGESVEVDLPKNSPLRPGDLLTAYEDSTRVLHPRSRTPQGYHVRVLGHLRLLSVEGGRGEGEIVEAYDAIGDRATFMPYRPPIAAVRPRPSPASLEGLVIDGPTEKSLFASSDVIFLDRGALHGVQPGMLLEIPLSPPGRRAEGFTELATPLARLMVVSVEDKTSAGLVLESRMSISAGDRFKASPTH